MATVSLPPTIYLGMDAATKKPIYVPRSIFGHMHIRGMTGEGKSSLALIPLVRQFAMPYDLAGVPQYDPIFIIDLGDDANLFWNAKLAADACGRKFRFLNLAPELESFCFPPFQAVPGGETNPLRIAQMLIRAFHMEHGLVYGGNYFSQQNLGALLRVSRKLSKETENPRLEDVARYLDDPKNRRQFKDADQVRMTFDFLLEYPQLRASTNAEENIDIAHILDSQDGGITYFFCPTLEEPITAPLVAGLALYTIISAAIQRRRRGLPRRRIRVYIDEFQEIIGRSLAALLAQSRKFHISLFLANQSTTQVQNRDLDLADQVFEGTRIKQYYTCVGEDDVKTLQSLSKDKIKTLGGTSGPGLQATSNRREIIVPSLERDEIIDVTDTFGDSFLVIKDGKGHREPIRCRQTHDYQDLSDKPLTPRKMSVAPPAPSTLNRAPTPPRDSPERRRRQDLLRALIERKRAAEAWETN